MHGLAGLLRPIPVLVLVLLLALLTGWVLPVGRPSTPEVPVVAARSVTAQEITPTDDPPRVRAAQVCLAADDSGSEYGVRSTEYGAGGSDPAGDRYAAAAQMLDYLVGLTLPQGVHEIAVVRFGSTAQVALPLTAVTGSGADVIRSALHPGPPLGATDYPAAIKACSHTLANAANPVIVVVGDGDPDLGDDRSAPALFADIATTVRDLGGVPVHVMLTVRSGIAPSAMALWQGTGVRTVLDVGIGVQLQRRVARQLIAILGSVIGVLPRPMGTLDAEHAALSVEVPAYAPSMTLTSFATAGSATVRLRDPSGVIVRTESGGIVDIAVPRPTTGSWRVEFVDGAPTVVQLDIAPLQARLLSPARGVPVGRPLTVSAIVGDGAALAPGGPPLYVGAVVESAGRSYELQLHHDGAGAWRSADAAPITQAGSVKVRLLLKSGVNTVLDSTTARFSATPTPYLVPDPPTVVARDGADYGWRLHQGGRPVPDGLLGEDPRAAVVVRIDDGPSQRAMYRGDGYWAVPASLLDPHKQVETQLSTRLLDGTTVYDVVSSTPTVVPPVVSVRVHRAIGAGASALVLVTTTWLVWLMVTTRSRLEGYLREPRGRTAEWGSSRPLRIRRRRWVRTGTTSRFSGRVVWLRRGALAERTGLVPWPFDARPSEFESVPARATGSSARR
ncbi:MAG: VWA domain-containing protein [Pseudonocardiaceae bacterium]